MPNETILKQEMSQTQQSGWHCKTCGVDTIQYGKDIPTACLNCGETALTKTWDHTIKTVTVVIANP